MPDQEQWLESLVARCLDAGDADYRALLDRLCAEHPAAAQELRARVAQLEKLGFVGARAPGSAAWLPDRIGRYQLTDLLGRGGMGVVFRGRSEAGDEVAVKLVRPDLLTDDRARVRFRREAVLVSRLTHPGICPVLEAGVDDGIPFLVMPLLEGHTFRAWVRDHRSEREQTLRHVESFARALHAAHEAGLVHRDVTPGNLFVTSDGRAVVFDFGLARDTTGQVATMTLSHEQIGTLPYMAPEQLGTAAHIDRRADVYALGVVLYETLAGRLPFETAHRSELTRLIASGESPRLRRLVRDLPRALDSIVHKAMDVDPAHRYATAAELADDLQRFGAGQPVLARDVGAVVHTQRWVRHHPVAATAISLLGVLVLVASVLVAGLTNALNVQRAAEAALRSRSIEQADPMNAIDGAIQAFGGNPGPKTLGQLNRVLHNVSLLGAARIEPSEVRGIAVSRLDANHDRIASITDGGLSLLTLDRRDGRLGGVQGFPVPDEEKLSCVQFSPDGRFLAWGGTKWFARRLAIGEQQPQRLLFPGHEEGGGEAWSIAVDNEGNVYAADTKGKIWHWGRSEGEAVDGQPMFNCRGPAVGVKEAVRGVHLVPGGDGDLLAWSQTWAAWRLGRDGKILWRWPPTGGFEKPPERMMGVVTPTAQVDLERDRVLLCQLDAVRALRWSDGTETWSAAAPALATEFAMVADGTVATLHRDGMLRFWSQGPTPIATWRDADDQIGGVLAVPGTNSFLAIGRGGTRTRIDGKGRVERTLLGGDLTRWGRLGAFAVSTDESILVAPGGMGRIRTWDFDGSRAPAQVRLVDSPPVAIAGHHDGRRLLIMTEDQDLRLWDPDTRTIEVLGPVPFGFRARNCDPDGNRVVFSGFNRQGARIAILDDPGRALRTPVRFGMEPEPGGQHTPVGVAWLPDNRLAIACGDLRFAPSRIQILDASGAGVPFKVALKDDFEVPLTTGRLTCLDASADGKRIAFGCVMGGIHVWGPDGKAGLRPLRSIDTRSQRVWSVDLAADGSVLVAGLEDGSVLHWRIDEAMPTVIAEPRDRPARCLLADQDRLLVEFAHDGLVRVWDCATLECVLEVPVADRGVVRDAVVLRASPGQPGDWRPLRLATISSDGHARVWSFDGEAMLKQARARLELLRQGR